MSVARLSRSDAYIPDRGDFARMVLHPHTGHEQGGERPVLVLSTRLFSSLSGYALVAPITRTARDWPFEIPIEPGSRVTGVVLSDQARSVDFSARHARFLGKASVQLTETVAERIATILGT
jgi:mRNA interferase MazF